MKPLKETQYTSLGFSKDKRKRRNQHRTAANTLLRGGGFFNGYSASGSTFGQVALWHLEQARYIK